MAARGCARPGAPHAADADGAPQFVLLASVDPGGVGAAEWLAAVRMGADAEFGDEVVDRAELGPGAFTATVPGVQPMCSAFAAPADTVITTAIVNANAAAATDLCDLAIQFAQP